MRLWPFAKKTDEVEALSPGCDLPEGVMLASPSNSKPATSAYSAPNPGRLMSSPVTEPQSPEAGGGSSRTVEAFLPEEKPSALPVKDAVPPFALAFEDLAMSSLPQTGMESLAPTTHSLESFQWTPNSNDTDEPSTFNLDFDAIDGDSLGPPPMESEIMPEPKFLPPTNLSEDWAIAPMPPMPETASPQASASPLTPKLSPEDLALTPPDHAAENLSALSDSPLQSAVLSQELGGMLAPEPMASIPAKPETESAFDQGLAATLAKTPQEAMMADMMPPPTQDLMQAFGVAPTWELEPAPELNTTMEPVIDFASDFATCKAPTDWPEPTAEAVSQFDLSSGVEPMLETASLAPEMMAPPMEGLDSWSDAEDVVSESADLNSSDAAYDMNHYDDPDAPAQAFELEKETEEFTPTGGGLQAMADMLAKVIPYETPEAMQQEAQDEEEANCLEIPSATEAIDAEEATSELVPLEIKPSPTHLTQELSTTVENMAPEEEPLPNLRGMDPLPVPKMLEALSAKFIARPKPKPQSAPLPMATHAPKPQAPAEREPDNASLNFLESAIIPNAKARTLSQAINNFEQEMLLNETRFVKQSINNLVDRYFAQQEPDKS